MIHDQKKESPSAAKRIFSNEFYRSSVVHWMLIAAILINVLDWGLLAFFIRPVDFPIILHYNVYFGVDLIGAWWQVYFLPGIGSALLITNSVLAFMFYQRKERILTHLLLLANVIVQVGITIAVAGLIRINY